MHVPPTEMPLSFVPSQSLSRPSQTSGVGGTSPTQSSTPAVQARVPGEHSPTSLPQAVPTWETLSSMVPLQLLSRPSHTSGTGPFGFLQAQEPPSHASVPLLQGAVSAPTPVQVAPAGGHQERLAKTQQLPASAQQPFWPGAGASASGASSTAPSQSLSAPSHTSGCGPTPPWQTSAPATHAVIPVVHGGWLTPQGTPTPKAPSSTWPSQSLSMPSQISLLGPTKPVQAPLQGFVPCWHWLVPP